MNFARPILLLITLSFAAALHAAPLARKAAAPAPAGIHELVLQAKPGYVLTLERMVAATRGNVSAARSTRTGAQIWQLEQAVDVAQANHILARLRLLPEVLWAELVPSDLEQAGALARFKAAQQQRSSARIVIRLRTREDLPSGMLRELSRAAGTDLAYERAMSGGAHVLRVAAATSLSELTALARRLELHPDVLYADPEVLAAQKRTPNDTYYALQWSFSELPGGISLPAAWDLTTGSASVVVAVIDSGILPHPDLLGKYLAGFDMVSDAGAANDGDGRDGDPTDPGNWVAADECGPGEPAQNSLWHGLHVAGIIGATTNNGMGVAGAGWSTAILPVRSGGKCGALSTDVIDSIRWAVGLAVPGVPANTAPAKVLNLSLAGNSACPSSVQSAINEAVASGAVLVVAAGNENLNVSSFWPANCSGVITVAANGRSGDATGYTNFGSLVKISAPGGEAGNSILSTYNAGTTVATGYGYQALQGTSMAAPHVSGVVALMFAVSPTLTLSQVLSHLQTTSRLFASGTWCATHPGNCGSGLLDAGAAVSAATGQLSPQTGWWWNPAQGGRGFMIEKRGGNLFMASYLYETDGRASWYASGGPIGLSSYQGALTAYAGGQTLVGPYAPPVSPGSAGNITLQFSNAGHGSLTWPGGTFPIERFNIVANGINAPPAAFQPESGWWWNPAESGRGFALEVQNGTLFMAGYMYDPQGNPIWFSTGGPMTSVNAYSGTWVQWANGQSLSGSYRAPAIVNANVGSVTLLFTSTTNAILTLPDGRQIALTRFPF